MVPPQLDVEQVIGKKGLLSRSLPSFEFRPQQLSMARKVERALQQKGVLLVEAGTGVGKTLAYLIPALLSHKRVLVSTGTKTLQEQIANKEIPFLKRILPFSFNVSFLKGRNNYLCLYRYHHLDPSFLGFQKNDPPFGEIEDWVQKTEFGDRAELPNLPDHSPMWRELSVTGEQCLGSGCESFHECFITRLRQEAMKADLLVVNHHLFFADLALRGNKNGEVLPPFDAVIFDEAHLLEEVASPFFGHHLSNYGLEELERDCYRELKVIRVDPHQIGHGLKHLGERRESFFGLFRTPLKTWEGKKDGNDFHEDGRWRLNPETYSDVFQEGGNGLHDILGQVQEDLTSLGERSEGVWCLIERTRAFQSNLNSFFHGNTSDCVTWVEVKGRGVFLQTTPVDISKTLQKNLFEQEMPMVLTSATLSIENSFEYLKKGLGLKHPDEVFLDSPFQFKNQLLYYFPPQMIHPQNEGFLDWASGEILSILKRSQGRAFVLVTSYRHLNEIFRTCRMQTDLPLLKQGDKPKHQLLQEFQDEVPSVIFATTSFWQGVDVQGKSLSCVIIVKLPFASPEDPLTAGKIEYFRKQGKDPFYGYQLPKAIVQLKQGIGRLIRTKTDRGIIAMLDKRILEQPYGAKFLKSLPEAPFTRDREEIERFLGKNM
ncbi:MAG TPA: ATP-dependent DNA helicase [Nitrospiria bacterium]